MSGWVTLLCGSVFGGGRGGIDTHFYLDSGGKYICGGL